MTCHYKSCENEALPGQIFCWDHYMELRVYQLVAAARLFPEPPPTAEDTRPDGLTPVVLTLDTDEPQDE